MPEYLIIRFKDGKTLRSSMRAIESVEFTRSPQIETPFLAALGNPQQLRTLGYLASKPWGHRRKEIADDLGLNYSSTRGYLKSLMRRGFVKKEGIDYRVTIDGMKALRL